MSKKISIFYVAALTLVCLAAALPSIAKDSGAPSGPDGNYVASDLVLTPGEDESKLNFAWITDDASGEECSVMIAKKRKGFKKPIIFTSENGKQYEDEFYTEIVGRDGSVQIVGDPEYYYCEVEVSNLKNQEDYIYRVGDGINWSEPYRYSTENRNRYGFVFLSDAQIGASKGSDGLANDIAAWANTLKVMDDEFPDTAFIMSAGDQIEVPGTVAQWTGFFSGYTDPDTGETSKSVLTSIPIAPTASSHDELGSGTGGPVTSYAFDYHFNLPNEDDPLEGLAMGDYYFTYGSALFMVLNLDSKDYDAHYDFIEEAISENLRAKWRILMWHYTIYTASDRSPSSEMVTEMYNIMDEWNIDLVFMGHDHLYCRTKQMYQGAPVTSTKVNRRGWVIDPEGTLYIDGGSSSGSKLYTTSPNYKPVDPDDPYGDWYWEPGTADFLAAIPYDDFMTEVWVDKPPPPGMPATDPYWAKQMTVPSFSYIMIEGNTLSITTYAVPQSETDSMWPIDDTYTIFKNKPPYKNKWRQ